MATAAVKTNIANWFEIPVTDLERASKFYEKVFDEVAKYFRTSKTGEKFFSGSSLESIS